MANVELHSSYIPKQFLQRKEIPFGSNEASDDSSEDEGNFAEEPGAFIIDKNPAGTTSRKTSVEIKNTEQMRIKNSFKRVELSSHIQPGINCDASYIQMCLHAKEKTVVPKLDTPALQNVLSKSALKTGFEKQHCIPEYSEGRRQEKRHRMAEKAKTRGSNWFNLPAQEMTDELRKDLAILQMRKSMDPKHFYKKNDPLPKYFQVGTVIESPADFYHSRIPKKDRKRTLVEELLSDYEFRKYGKKKYAEIISKQPKWKFARKKEKKL